MTFQQTFFIVVLLNAAAALLLTARLRRVDQVPGTYSRSRPVAIAYLAAVTIALLLVGVVSNTMVRHIIQVVPLVLTALLATRFPQYAGSAAIPLLTFWLLVMCGIWLFLLGIYPVFTGTFSVTEIVLTIIIGLASVIGLVAINRQGTTLALRSRLSTTLLLAILQPIAMVFSFGP